MISWDFTESRTSQPPMAAAASSINARPAAGPVGGADEQADNSTSRLTAIANIDTLPLQAVTSLTAVCHPWHAPNHPWGAKTLHLVFIELLALPKRQPTAGWMEYQAKRTTTSS